MVIVIIKMNALPEKCLELKQTLLALIEPIRKMKGCLSHNIFLDIENENILSLIEEWESRKDLDNHLQSEKFTLLMGTRYLLSRPLEITMSEVSHSSGWEAIEAVRR